MDTPYVLSFEDFMSVCNTITSKHKQRNGDCKNCSARRICRYDKKTRDIDAALLMGKEESRFPRMLSVFQKNPSLLYIIPSTIYEKMYGTYHENLPCPFLSESFLQHIEEIKATYSILTDEESKNTLLNVLMYRLTFNKDYILRAYCTEPQYFIKPFRGLGSEEVFVDCGAYIGDTFEQYCEYNLVPKMAYLFEPDQENVELIKKNNQCSHILIIEKGAYQFSGQLFFVQRKKTEGYLSEYEEDGGVPLPVTSIDDAIKENISFIKMDIEGSEYKAIIGAQDHIRNDYPKLAICVYHSPEDLWEIPLMIHRMFPKYNKFELRHHSKDFRETVLYVYCL